LEKYSWYDRVRNELLHGVKKGRKEGRLTGLITSGVRTAFHNTLWKERQMEGLK